MREGKLAVFNDSHTIAHLMQSKRSGGGLIVAIARSDKQENTVSRAAFTTGAKPER